MTVTVVRDRKIRTALRTNQIPGFVTVPAWKKNKDGYFTEENTPVKKFARHPGLENIARWREDMKTKTITQSLRSFVKY